MKYFTKDYYKYLDSLGSYDFTFDIIKDKAYSNQEIEDLVAKNRESYINDMEEDYKAPPVYEEWEEDALYLEDVLVGDILEDGEEDNLRHPKSWEEFYSYKKSQYEKDLADFKNRPTFDRVEAGRDFDLNFNMLLDRDMYELPDFVFDEVDIRILALNLMPKSTYKRIEKENKKIEKLRENKEKEVRKLVKKNTNYTKYEILKSHLHLYNILTEISKNEDGDYFFYLDDKERALYFKDLLFIENEIETCHEDLYIYNYEIYDLEDGEEYHFILFDDHDGQYKYLTIRTSESGLVLDDEEKRALGLEK